MALGRRKPAGGRTVWAERPEHTIDPTLQERPPKTPTPWWTEK
jgi:hypothetical protein